MNVFSAVWNAIVAALNWLLQGLYDFTGNYGIAIILLTIIAKIIMLPLTIKQTRSMIAMQKIQPEIKKLQEKYKDDKEKLSQEMMKFYKENKVNPLGGCLPLLLQLPVFFALFTVLRKYIMTPPTMIVGNTFAVFSGLDRFKELPTAVFAAGGSAGVLPYIKPAGFLWINNLADTTRFADPYFVLVILLMLSTWYSQKQVMTDPRQKSMLYIMPLIMGFIAMSLPAGVILYWLTTNILQILQQFAMEYYDKKRPKETVKPKEEKKEPEAKRAAKAGQAPQKGQLLDKAREQAKGKAADKTPAKAAARQPAKSAPGRKARQPAKSAPGAKPKDKAPAQKGQPGGKRPPSGSKAGKASQVKKPKSPPPQQSKNNKGAKSQPTKKGKR